MKNPNLYQTPSVTVVLREPADVICTSDNDVLWNSEWTELKMKY